MRYDLISHTSLYGQSLSQIYINATNTDQKALVLLNFIRKKEEGNWLLSNIVSHINGNYHHMTDISIIS